MKKSYIAFMIVILGFSGVVSKANAHDSVGFSINLGGPAYYGPPPVYVAPSVRYAPAPVVYYQPAAVYYSRSAFFSYDDEPRRYYGHQNNGFHHGGHGHHGH